MSKPFYSSKPYYEIIKFTGYNAGDMSITLIAFAEKTKREGILVLEDDLEDIAIPFFRTMLQHLIDAMPLKRRALIGRTYIEGTIHRKRNQLEAIVYILLHIEGEHADALVWHYLVAKGFSKKERDALLALHSDAKTFAKEGVPNADESELSVLADMLRVAVSKLPLEEKRVILEEHVNTTLSKYERFLRIISGGTVYLAEFEHLVGFVSFLFSIIADDPETRAYVVAGIGPFEHDE